MKESRAVLLLNLGSPDAPSVPAVKKYLREFLGDKHVISLPWILRKILLECVILPRRPKKSAAYYSKIWTENGSPLIVETEKLRERVTEKIGGRAKVFCAMRYGNPGIENAAKTIYESGIRKVFVIPLYPQKAESSWLTAVEKTQKVFAKKFPQVKLDFAAPYYCNPEFIAALEKSAKKFLIGKNFEKLLISFHGVPVKTKLSKSYKAECETTAELLASALNLPRERWECVFQSRFGRGKWLEPSTGERLKNLPKEGVKNIAIIAPGFAADCLETLEELGVRGKKTFSESGGNNFHMVPCLNDSEDFANFLVNIAQKNSGF
ncbi:MAG: ferrochelatase [Opitutales bacterium]|nr:ferrochelatase [Opitutales bacterium]